MADQGKLGAARRLLLEALEISRSDDDLEGTGLALLELGHLARLDGDAEEEIRLFGEAVGALEQAGEQQALAKCLIHLGEALARCGSLTSAKERLHAALQLAQEPFWRSACLDALGEVALEQENYPAARSPYEEALAPNRGSVPSRVAYSLNQLGALERSCGRASSAIELHSSALAHLEDEEEEALTLNLLGLGHLDLGNSAEALDLFVRSSSLSESTGDSSGLATCLNNIGLAIDQMGAPTEALPYLQQSVSLLESAEEPLLLSRTLRTLAEVYSDLGEKSEARACIARAAEVEAGLT